MPFKIIFDYRVIKNDFKSIDEASHKRILKNIAEKLKDSPRDFGKPLRHQLKGLYRLRVGDYRVINFINFDEQTVIILKIGHRSEVYEEIKKRLK